MTTLERIPALGAAESLAKYGSLANLFEWSELFATMIWPGAKVPQRGRSRAEVVLGPFASTTKIAPFGIRQATSSAAGPKPGIYHKFTSFTVRNVRNVRDEH